jgi:osmotically-inducible protein OsmY
MPRTHHVREFVIAAVLALGLGACGNNPARVELGVDVYLHPDSASPNDVLLQTAIARSISANTELSEEAIHVRSFETVVFLSGSVREACASDDAGALAQATTVSVDGGPPVRARRVENAIVVPEGDVCDD